MSWSGDVADHLLASKRQGLPWQEAKRLATNAHPPRGRDAAVATLFDERGDAHDTVVSFFWRVAERAYNDVVGPVGGGNGPELRHFTPGMLRDLDSSTPARGRRRVAA